AHERHVLEPIGRELFRQSAEEFLKRAGLLVEIDEQEAAPGVEADRQEAVLRLVEAKGLVHLRGAAQPSVELVGPAVIRAGYQLAIARAFEQFRAAMA